MRVVDNVAWFWVRVKVGKKNECWPWLGGKTRGGYGDDRRKTLGVRRAHRAAWVAKYGYIPELQVLHKCDNRICCNPNHLYLGDHQDNMDDMRKEC